jgi:hypothetical protein
MPQSAGCVRQPFGTSALLLDAHNVSPTKGEGLALVAPDQGHSQTTVPSREQLDSVE